MNKSMIMFFALLVSVVFIAGCAGKTTVYPPQGQVSTPAEQPAAAPSSSQPSAAPEAAPASPEPTVGTSEGTILESTKCESDYGIGVVPGTCTFVATDVLKITLKAMGKHGIDGMVFYATGPTGTLKNLKDTTKVSTGQAQPYSLSLSDIEAKVGGNVDEILALPVKNANGTEYACYNQRVLIVSGGDCK